MFPFNGVSFNPHIILCSNSYFCFTSTLMWQGAEDPAAFEPLDSQVTSHLAKLLERMST